MISTTPELTDAEFDEIRRMVYDRLGINLTEQKRSLVVGRLQKLLREHGLRNFADYIRYVREDHTGSAFDELANRISTNHTFFYREPAHFDFFRKQVLPEVRERHARDRDIRIWCAGCSSGEEPYTMVIEMMEFFGREYAKWNAGVLATDISSRVLDLAARGIYGEERLREVPKNVLSRYFEKQEAGEWQVREFVRREVTFRRLNLMNEKFPFRKPFDLILCRNVMIYFDQPTRNALVQRYYDNTVNGGYLFIGHSETLGRGETLYNYVQPAVYRKG